LDIDLYRRPRSSSGRCPERAKLKLLKEARLVSERRYGTKRLYQVRMEGSFR